MQLLERGTLVEISMRASKRVGRARIPLMPDWRPECELDMVLRAKQLATISAIRLQPSRICKATSKM